MKILHKEQTEELTAIQQIESELASNRRSIRRYRIAAAFFALVSMAAIAVSASRCYGGRCQK